MTLCLSCFSSKSSFSGRCLSTRIKTEDGYQVTKVRFKLTTPIFFSSGEGGHHFFQANNNNNSEMEIQHCPTFALYWLKRPGWKAPFRVDLVKILNSTGLVCIATAKSEEARWVSRTWWDASISTLCLPGWEELAAHPVNQTLPDSPISQGQQRPSFLWPGAPRLTLSLPCFCGGILLHML